MGCWWEKVFVGFNDTEGIKLNVSVLFMLKVLLQRGCEIIRFQKMQYVVKRSRLGPCVTGFNPN